MRAAGWRTLCSALASLTASTFIGCETKQTPITNTGEEATGYLAEPIAPVQTPKDLDADLVALGERLFHDRRLSKDGSISCATCHDVSQGGDDGLARSKGINGALGEVNAPTVLNSGFNFAQFWDGRAKTLEDQVNGPVTHPLEMGSTWEQVVAKLSQDRQYLTDFARHYPDGVKAKNVRHAIATFERSLVTEGAPFDRWLLGEEQALTDQARRGYETFKSVGCVACHQGRNLGGNMYQRFGVLGDYFKDRGDIKPSDLGRFNVTQQPEDKFMFRVPTLRNVELTAPYFHDGTADTLDAAVRVMAKYQLGRKLTQQQLSDIVAFLEALTGNLPQVGTSVR